jgi:DNA-binding MarR family transcriptional regulator
MTRVSSVPRASRRLSPDGGRDARDTLSLSAWLRLLKAHGLVLRAVRRSVPAPLTVPQFDVLAQLARRPAGMTPGELTRELLVTAGNVTGIVARLRRMGLVTRGRVPEDRRAVRIALTSAGRLAFERIRPAHRREVARLFDGLEARDLARLRALLGELNHAIEARQP